MIACVHHFDGALRRHWSGPSTVSSNYVNSWANSSRFTLRPSHYAMPSCPRRTDSSSSCRGTRPSLWHNSGRYYFSFSFSFSISYFCLMDWASLLRCICAYFLLNWVTRILNVPLFVCSRCRAKSSDQHMRLLFTSQPSQGDTLIAKLIFGP